MTEKPNFSPYQPFSNGAEYSLLSFKFPSPDTVAVSVKKISSDSDFALERVGSRSSIDSKRGKHRRSVSEIITDDDILSLSLNDSALNDSDTRSPILEPELRAVPPTIDLDICGYYNTVAGDYSKEFKEFLNLDYNLNGLTESRRGSVFSTSFEAIHEEEDEDEDESR